MPNLNDNDSARELKNRKIWITLLAIPPSWGRAVRGKLREVALLESRHVGVLEEAPQKNDKYYF